MTTARVELLKEQLAHALAELAAARGREEKLREALEAICDVGDHAAVEYASEALDAALAEGQP